jgi:transcriptional regulator with XRE-family HTH domain
MDHEEIPFEKIFTERLKQKGISIKKLAEVTGIARNHLENIASGNFKDMPSAPYFRGYLIRIGKVLDFDGETWWEEIKKGSVVKKSGIKDTLPENRFTKKRPMRLIWIGAVIIIVIVYAVLRFAQISGKPGIALVFPAQNPYNASSPEITLQGTITNADSLSVNGDGVPITAGGAWQKDVLLQNGLNTFALSAKKFLGGESDVVEQILYTPAVEASGTVSSSSNGSTSSSATTSSMQ